MKNTRKDYRFTILIVVVNKAHQITDTKEIPFIAEGTTYAQARTKALNYGQAILRDYDKQNLRAFMRVCKND